MDVVELLERDGDVIVGTASETLASSRLPHYAQAGQAAGYERLERLFRLTVQCISERDLAPVMIYMTEVADERFHAGYAIREVQIAINVLEETIWNHIVENVAAEELSQALGLVTTVLGAAKDSLARAYVSLAGTSKALSLDLTALFRGPQGG
jgi:hypothetical protein